MASRRLDRKQAVDSNDRNQLRDVTALAMLPAMWLGADQHRVAESLAAALYTTLRADFVYVSLEPGEGQEPVSIAQTGRYSTSATLAAKCGPEILAWSQTRDPDELLPLPDPVGDGVLRIAAHPIGRNAELGVIAAGFLDEKLPGEFELLLLSVGASQAATATQNIRLVQSVRRRTDQYLALFNQSPLGIYLVDSEFRIREMNPVAQATFGDAPGGYVGWDFNELLHNRWDDAYAEEIAKIVRHTLETGEPYSTLDRADTRRDTGTVESYEWRLDRIALQDGGVGVLCHFRDISAEALARLRTAESEERFRALVTASTDVVYCMSPDWREMRYLDGRNFVPDTEQPSDLWIERYLHPIDKSAVLAAIQSAIDHEEMFEMEHRVVRVDGTVGWTHSRAVPIRDEEGKIREWFGAASDVTRRHTAEQALDESQAEIERQRRLYEAILTNTPDLAYVWDLNHRFTYANDVLLTMWGKTREEAIGKNCLELGYEPWHAAMHDREIDHVVATKKPVRGEVPFAGTFGRRIYDYILVPVVGPDGNVEAVAGTTRDVTDYRLAEERLRDSDRAKDDFIATLAHELRNPLAPIRTGLELIKLNNEPAAIEKTRIMMERQVEQLIALVDDLLDVSRITRDKLELRREAVSLARVVEVAVDTARPLVDRLGHDLAIHLPEAPVTVDADPNRFAQILSNLLSNAAKYTPKGGHITLTAEVIGKELRVSVKDDGIGIPAEMVGRIFEMFAQVNHPLQKGHTGLGIGLTLVKSLVELHCGTITVHSRGQNKGTEFEIRLPIVLKTESAPVQTQQGRNETSTRRKVLVVDDNDAAVETLSMLVEMLGNEVRTAHDGQQAVEAAAEFRPDLVLMDIGMPRMDGYEAARVMRRQPWGTGITLVALTGWGQDTDKARTKEAGFDHHLVKPVDPQTLGTLLHSSNGRGVED